MGAVVRILLTPAPRAGVAVATNRRSLPLPRSFAFITARDVSFVIGLLGAIVGAMWIRHGGLGRDPLTAVGEVTALVGTYAALVGVLFMARAPWLDQVFGADRLRSEKLFEVEMEMS